MSKAGLVVPGFALATAGGFMMYGAVTGRNPADVFASVVQGKSLPDGQSWHPFTVDRETSKLDTTASDTSGGSTTPGGSSARNIVVNAALSQVGKKYLLGTPVSANNPNPSTFDCSGLTMWAYNKIGIKLPHHAASQQLLGKATTLDAAQPGDLIFWGAVSGHVVMYLGNKRCVEAPHTGDVVKTRDLWDLAHIRVRSYISEAANGSVSV